MEFMWSSRRVSDAGVTRSQLSKVLVFLLRLCFAGYASSAQHPVMRLLLMPPLLLWLCLLYAACGHDGHMSMLLGSVILRLWVLPVVPTVYSMWS
jgi:hypothetical protein